MAQQERNPYKLKSPGPYLAIVKNHLDPGYMGGLEVALIKGFVDDTEKIKGQSVKVKYLNPFYGVTNYKFEGRDENDDRNFNEVQKSYGMWFVPPDIGTMVLVIFVGGEYNEGYWFGCVQDRYQNHMIPGIAAQELSPTWLTSEQQRLYGTGVNYLPVAELNKHVSLQKNSVADIQSRPKPIHPFADRLAMQGLLKDKVRGVTSSGARREIPSTVFGISTPGPLDKAENAKKGSIEYDSRNTTPSPVSRLGGTTFVMDDGDANGDNELVRIRTRTGHQILLHNTQDLIYIANGKGTAWIELSSNGKIDIFAQDSVSIHSEGDFNLRAGKDFNIEAVGNLNLHSFGNTNIDSNKTVNINAGENLKMSSVQALYMNSDSTIQLNSISTQLKSTNKLELAGDVGVDIVGSVIKATGSSSVNIKGSTVKVSAGKVYTNDSKNPAEAASATSSDIVKADKLLIRNLPATNVSIGWESDAFFNAGDIQTAVYRAPMHEPWPLHENIAPTDVPAVPGVVTYVYSSDVWFDVDKFDLKSDGIITLTDFAKKYRDQGTTNQITVIGHTDDIASLAFNQFLSIKRAEAVKAFLVSQRIPTQSIIVNGRGETEPVAPNQIDGKDNPEGRAKNRRIEIRVGGTFKDPRTLPATTATITSSDIIVYPKRGGQASFLKLNPDFQTALQNMAVEYKNVTGRPLVINSAFRSQQEQQALYDAWVKAGGNRKTNPSVYTPQYGMLYIPTNPATNEQSSHSLGIAIDTSQAPELESRGLLSKYNMYRPSPYRDPVHIAFRGGKKQGRTE
jgi:outer membrane protein OmpA-like peptidoglycan-associated protein